MKCIISNCEDLLKPVKVVEGIVEKRQTLPILSNILVEQDGTSTRFTTTDLDIQIRTEAPIGTEGTKTSFTVAAGTFSSVLSTFPAKSTISISFNDGKLELESNTRQVTLQTMPADEYPVLNETDPECSITLPASKLRYLLTMTSFAMASQEVRYFLNGVFFVIEGQTVRTVATDTHRMACCDLELEEQVPEIQAIIPRKTVRELIRQLPEDDTPVEILFADTQVCFKYENVSFVSKLIEGKFPDYKRVLPTAQSNPKDIILDREMLISALRGVSVMTSDKYHGVRWVLTHNHLEMQCTNSSHEEAREDIDLKWEFEDLDMGFNVTYLLEVLNTLKNKEVCFSFSSASGSVLITMPDAPERFRYVVMPMRI